MLLTGRPCPVRAPHASGVNILVTYPDTRRTMEALRSLEFVVVAAHAMTRQPSRPISCCRRRRRLKRRRSRSCRRGRRCCSPARSSAAGLRVEKPEGKRLHRRGLTEPSRRPLLPCRVEYKSQIPASFADCSRSGAPRRSAQSIGVNWQGGRFRCWKQPLGKRQV